jgi:hypothetical protein
MNTTLSNASSILSYPGITAEFIPNIWRETSERAYEAVLNCGWAFLTPAPILTPTMIARGKKLSNIGLRSLVLASDRGLLASEMMQATIMKLREYFPEWVRTLPIDRNAPTKVFGMNVLSSTVDLSVLQELRDTAPESLAITSLPYCDPSNIAVKIDADDSLLDRSLSLFAINNRSIPTDLAREFVGARGQIDATSSIDGLTQLFDENPQSIFVFKPVGQRAGGTSTQIVGPSQRTEFIRDGERTLYEVYDFFTPTLVDMGNNRKSPSQLRPFVIDGELFGFCIKLPASSMGDCIDSTGVFKLPTQSLRNLNDAMNSSSGKSVSLFFDRNGVFVSGSRGIRDTLSPDDVASMSIADGWSLGNAQFTQGLALRTIESMILIQRRVNEYLGTDQVFLARKSLDAVTFA